MLEVDIRVYNEAYKDGNVRLT